MATKAIKICAVNFFKKFLDEVVPTNRQLAHFNRREIEKKLSIANGRLVGQVEEMLNKWREKGVNGALSPLPVFVIGFDKGYSSTGREKGIGVVEKNYIVNDDLGNFFKVRVSKHDQRVQAVLFAPDHDTAFSLADQFKLFCARYENRHHYAITEYNGIPYPFAMTLEDNSIFGDNQQIPDQDNLTVLVFDLSFNCHTPYFVGDEINNEPYLPVINTVVIKEQHYKSQLNVYEKVVRG